MVSQRDKHRARILHREAQELGIDVMLPDILTRLPYWERAIHEAKKARQRKEKDAQ